MTAARGKLRRIDVERPIVLGHYTLTATGLEVQGQPTLDEHEGVGAFIRRAHNAAGFWLADWLRYGEHRAEHSAAWQERLEQMVDATHYSEKTLKNVRAVGAVEKSRRRDDVEFGHHEAVAGLEPEEQTEWLEKAATEGYNVRELRQEIRAARRTKIIDGQAVLAGMYRIIYADPPWLYGDSGPTDDGSLGKAERHYPGMTIEAICALPVQAHALKNSVLFMWATTPLLLQNPGPREVLEAWGFTYKSNRSWDKVLGNPGHYALDVTHETLIIATRGDGQPDKPTPHEKSAFTERRSPTHSEKPESVRRWIEKHWTRGPYLELFGRAKAEGWDVFGNDARLWAKEAAS